MDQLQVGVGADCIDERTDRIAIGCGYDLFKISAILMKFAVVETPADREPPPNATSSVIYGRAERLRRVPRDERLSIGL